MLWKKLDGAKINGGTMRISFSPPGRLAATLLGGQVSQKAVRVYQLFAFFILNIKQGLHPIASAIT